MDCDSPIPYRRTENVARRLAERREAIVAAARAAAAFTEAVKSSKPAILHLRIDPEAITPTTTLTALRENAMAARGG